MCRFHGTLEDVAGFVDGVSYLATASFDGFLLLFAETLCLLLEVVGGIFEIVPCILNSLAELFAGLSPCLWSVEQSDCGTCGYTDAEGEPAESRSAAYSPISAVA